MGTANANSDPTAYRYFAVLGRLRLSDGAFVHIAHGAHASNLPAGEAGKQEIVERVRRHYGELYSDPYAQWEQLEVFEVIPTAVYWGPLPL